MSAAKHTPGPWTRDSYGHIVDRAGQDVRFRSLTILASSSQERIAQAEANTDLAAAAPELLANLQFAVKLMRPIFGGSAQVEHMESVIAKATGGAA